MPRKKRKLSSTGFYHVMLKGIDDRNIFLDDYDRMKFLKILRHASYLEKSDIYLYCLMSNHVHILMKNEISISATIKRTSESYAKYINLKYDRVGHLFQNRFKSEPVESHKHLIVLFSYIHNNPVKAKMIACPYKYEWSSCKTYYFGDQSQTWIDTSLYLDIFQTNEALINAMLDYRIIYKPSWKKYNRFTDDELSELIKSYRSTLTSSCDTANLILQIRQYTNASYRQLSRVFGVSKGIIEKNCNPK